MIDEEAEGYCAAFTQEDDDDNPFSDCLQLVDLTYYKQSCEMDVTLALMSDVSVDLFSIAESSMTAAARECGQKGVCIDGYDVPCNGRFIVKNY